MDFPTPHHTTTGPPFIVSLQARTVPSFAEPAQGGAACPRRVLKKWGEPRYARHGARCKAGLRAELARRPSEARSTHSQALRRGAPTKQVAPCRRNPKGTGGLRRHTASELLPDALASLSSSFLVWHSQAPCARPHPTSSTPFKGLEESRVRETHPGFMDLRKQGGMPPGVKGRSADSGANPWGKRQWLRKGKQPRVPETRLNRKDT
jgi:hypothetical protein